VKRFVISGDCLSIGGFTIDRNPMALTYEALRQRLEGLHVVMHSGSQALDLLIGAGRAHLLEIACGANRQFIHHITYDSKKLPRIVMTCLV